MFNQADMGKDVKIRLLNAELVRGYVLSVGASYVRIETDGGQISVPFNKISTVTWVGDHSS